MKIAFYAPFKPLTHKNPSGDLMIARGLVDFLQSKGHIIEVQSTLRTRWIYLKPLLLLKFIVDFIKVLKNLYTHKPDCWLTYHTYYKAPDILGPLICKILNIKYIIFQGIYSTKPKRRFKTIIGFCLNRLALQQADYIFTNKLSDLKNLERVIPQYKLCYIKPGIKPCDFQKNKDKGVLQRKKWGIAHATPVILTAGMFRDDVKTKGLAWLIRCCERVMKSNIKFHLVIAGAGRMENQLKALAEQRIPDHHTFAGKIKRDDMYTFYSSGDIFAFPGINESLGMVYLEAQACRLPVIAFNNGGIPEIMIDKKTGFLIPMYNCKIFSDTLVFLLNNQKTAQQIGEKAQAYVEQYHDIELNYQEVEKQICKVTQFNV